MKEKAQFPKWKIGMLFIWTLIIATFPASGEELFPLKKELHSYESSFADLQINGPTNLCLVAGGVLGTFSAGGETGDVYEWTVSRVPSGEVLEQKSSGQLETYKFYFSEVGNYNVNLRVRRGTDADFYVEDKPVQVQKGPDLALLPDYLLCAGSSTLLTAIDPNTPNLSDYTITWYSLNDVGERVEIGRGNEFETYSAGYHIVELYQTNPDGSQSCLINGSTFVGPPIDFQIIPSSTQICEGETIEIGLDTPLSGEWFIQKDYTGVRKSLGNGFDIELESDELSGPGLYLVTFQTYSEDFPDCLSERIIGFELLEAPKVTPTILSQPNDCSIDNGSFQLTFDTEIDAFYIPELNIIEGPRSAGEQVNYSSLPAQVYSVVLEKNGCQTTTLVALDNLNPPTEFNPSYSYENESCSPTGVFDGITTIDFGTTVANSEYRVLSQFKGEVESGTIPTSGQVQINIPNGNYLLELKVGGCTYPIQDFKIENAPQVNFTVPLDLNICETFQLDPETDQNLNFTLTYPDGSEKSIQSGESFLIEDEGAYSIYGESNDPSSNLCPKTINFNATYSSSISFAPVLTVEKCFDPIKYTIDLEGIELEEASIRWLNDEGKIVGRSGEFYPSSIGFYSLLVQPKSSGYCPVQPVGFEVVAPITNVPMDLEATKICPDPGLGLITLETDEDEVTDIEWVFYDSLNNRTELTEFDGLLEIESSQAGSYEAIAYNKLGCEIGRGIIEVELSELTTPPTVEDSYAWCSIENNTIPAIDPGEFESYFWYFEDELVSTASTFKPEELGDYRLDVITEDGCMFSKEFSTYDACNFNVVYPNAMILGNPDKDFRIILSEGVSQAELFILNRQGALIHHDLANEIPVNSPILNWDGKVNGKDIPEGTYVVVLLLRNDEFGFEDKVTSSLLVLQ
ncbi:hypothetical protein [Algoriphagus machipongonensis]|uniref:Uncharacterized protein n=1 Tax=Algoriphagus machipongonensis TaxID=388413 RepID=A3HYN2_9BACT|nr:hypothetical protein [Algoriphagus machipongonensis]EAZ80368.1 hypothetical protein ALPR1_05580 [Algoriphagus machipongonensis]